VSVGYHWRNVTRWQRLGRVAEANNDIGALLAQSGNLDEAIGRFRAALASTPEYPTRGTILALPSC